MNKTTEKGDQAKKIVDQIKKENIKPKPKWECNWKGYLFWMIWGLVIVLGSMFFSLILLNISEFSFDFWKATGFGRATFIMFRTAPYLWIALLLFAMLIGYIAFRKTKRGYRRNAWLIIGLVLLFVIALGVAIHWSRANSGFEKGLIKKFPRQKGLFMMREKRFEMPDEGILGGIVIASKENSITLKSLRGNEWEVIITKQTKIKRAEDVVEEKQIIILGRKIDENTFEAKIIKPMKRPREEFIENHRRLPEEGGKIKREHGRRMRLQ